jgi:hypothetical protein
MILIDPQWITATTQSEDFFQGLDAWHVWKEFGPAEAFWRDRTAGARLIDHPHRTGAKALLIGKSDEYDADCASWNFPATSKGALALRIMPRDGFAGLNISLNDRFFNPGDGRGDAESIFGVQIGASGEFGGRTKLPLGQWSSLKFQWDLPRRECTVLIDDRVAHVLKLNRLVPHGISYLSLRSLADQVDLAGCLVESTSIEHF